MADVKWSGGKEHWIKKGDVKLFLWEKPAAPTAKPAGTILFVHGSSMASQPTFDLHVPGRPYSSAMDWFAERGFNTWCMDNEGYGRSDKNRPINFDISNGADDLAAGSEYILEQTGAGKLLVYGISSGALKAALFAQRHAQRVARLALDAFVWTGEGSPTLHERKKKLADFKRTTAALSIAPSYTAFSAAIMPSAPTPRRSAHSPMQSWRSTIRCPPAPMSICAPSCRWSTRRRSPSPRSFCAANTTALPASTTCSRSSSCCPTWTSSSA